MADAGLNDEKSTNIIAKANLDNKGDKYHRRGCAYPKTLTRGTVLPSVLCGYWSAFLSKDEGLNLLLKFGVFFLCTNKVEDDVEGVGKDER